MEKGFGRSMFDGQSAAVVSKIYDWLSWFYGRSLRYRKMINVLYDSTNSFHVLEVALLSMIPVLVSRGLPGWSRFLLFELGSKGVPSSRIEPLNYHFLLDDRLAEVRQHRLCLPQHELVSCILIVNRQTRPPWSWIHTCCPSVSQTSGVFILDSISSVFSVFFLDCCSPNVANTI